MKERVNADRKKKKKVKKHARCKILAGETRLDGK